MLQERDAEQTPPAEKVQAPQEQNLATKQPSPKEASEPRESKGRPEVARRNSRVLETAELFSRSTSADRMGQKKLPFIAGVKVIPACILNWFLHPTFPTFHLSVTHPSLEGVRCSGCFREAFVSLAVAAVRTEAGLGSGIDCQPEPAGYERTEQGPASDSTEPRKT